MQMVKLTGQMRNVLGTRAVRRLRKQGLIPAIVYGHRQTPTPVVLDRRTFEEISGLGAHLLELQIDGVPHAVLIKDIQYDHLGLAPIHVDFVRVDLHERVRVSVRLEFRGTPVGCHEGGVFEPNMVDLEIETLANQIPDAIRVNVADMKVGDLLHVRELVLPENVTAVSPADAIVCAVRQKVTAAALEARPETEELQQPEIITARKEKEEGEAEEK